MKEPWKKFRGERNRSAADNDVQNSRFLPQEVVVQILPRLPIKSLFRFKCVSKQWNSIISKPKFGHASLQRARSRSKSLHLWELLPYIPIPQTVTRDTYRYLDFGHAHLPSLAGLVYQYDSIKENNRFIAASSNGLILASNLPLWEWNPSTEIQLCVSNPLTKQSVLLPSLSSPVSSRCVLGFSTRRAGGENAAAFVTYKVVLFEVVDFQGRFYEATIQIFSSETGSWTGKELIKCPEVVFDRHRPRPFTFNGILHWFDTDTRTDILTYDPYGVSNRLGHIQLPPNRWEQKCAVNLIDLGDEDVLRYGEIANYRSGETRLRVWRLVDSDKGEWCLERVCVISPKDSLRSSDDPTDRPVPDLWIPKFYGRLFEVSSDPSDVMAIGAPLGYMGLVVPVTLCPWSSPFYSQPAVVV